MRYVAFDVETPNRYNNRMSAIGIAVVEDGRIADTFYSPASTARRSWGRLPSMRCGPGSSPSYHPASWWPTTPPSTWAC